IGKMVGGAYRVTSCIGRGGMGVVYLARQVALDRDVVVKLMGVDADGDAVARFQREARSLSRLSHPNVVQVIDYGRDPDTNVLFIVMEYVRGITLGRYLKRVSRMPLPDFTVVAEQILAGVSEAHRHGLVHRDLKPSNIMLSVAEGELPRVKLLDFGLSKFAAGEEPLTQVNEMVGSAMYIAPEQIRGKSVDARADVYTLGVLFYQMLTGAKPYPGEDHELFAQQLGNAFVPIAEQPTGADVPRPVAELVERCLSADPARRPTDARQLHAQLGAVLGSATPHPIRFDSGGSDTGGRSVDVASMTHSRSRVGPMSQGGMSQVSVAGPPQGQTSSRVTLVVGLGVGMVGLLALLVTLLLVLVVIAGGTFRQPAPPPAVAVSQDQLSADALRASGLSAMQAGEYDRSVALLTEAVRLSPEAGDLKDLLVIVIDLRDRQAATRGQPARATQAETVPGGPAEAPAEAPAARPAVAVADPPPAKAPAEPRRRDIAADRAEPDPPPVA
ncbi:MAG: serine/threonine-protein kinase, partial [Myxococcota bacterium]